MSSGEEIAEQLRLLREGYARELPAKLALLEQTFRNRRDEGALRKLRHLAHGLAGSGATFGYPELSEAARRLEIVVDAALAAGQHLSEAQSESSADLLEALYRAARQPAVSTPSLVEPKTVQPGVARKLIYLVEDDAELAANLALQLGHFGYRVRTFATLEQLSEAVADPALAAVVMDIIFPQGELAGVEAVVDLSKAKRLVAPVVFMSVRGDLPARLAAARTGAAAYFVKPLEVDALVSALDGLTTDQPPEPYRVLIMDDIESLAQHYAYTLRSAGMLTDVATDPMQILTHLADFKPELVLMDMYMPGCTGAELAGVIRQLDYYNVIPIVFLSAEGDPGKQLAAMALGGDDFLTKPIAPEHLISAVSVRIQRYRTLHGYIERDGLTGLFNHAATKEHLAVETARAARKNHTFSFAMIDMDNFKAVNDAYGHLAGDRVLKNFAKLFRQRLRKTDIIGRMGGEEFAAILPDTRGVQAMDPLDELREAFSRVRQYADDGREFTTTFSCGIAEYRRGARADAVNALADQALYQAKQAGRNRIVIAG
ncbi:MAG: diguanylate cyclase [Betaproteobacteria bacterium]|nr:diguanylate cyclase [Betaproteobacteria bacterium]